MSAHAEAAAHVAGQLPGDGQVWVSVTMVMSGWGTAVNSYTVGRSPVWRLVLDGFFIVNGLRIMVARRRHDRRWA
jgi:hypothetical protein